MAPFLRVTLISGLCLLSFEALAQKPKKANKTEQAKAEKPEAAKPVDVAGFITKHPIFFSGSLRFRHEDHQWTDMQSVRSFSLLRARMEFQIKPIEEKWSVFLQPQFVKAYGEQFYTPQAAGGANANAITNSSGNTADNSVLFHQGYLKYNPSDFFSLIVGREELAYGNELIIGKLNWGNVGRSFDVIRARYERGDVWSDLFVAKVVDTNTNIKTSTYKGDRDLYGSYSSFKQVGWVDTIDLYALQLRDHEVKPDYSVLTLGTRLVSKVKKADYRLEMNKQVDMIQSSTIDGEIGYTFDDAKKFRLGAGAFIAEADYEHYYPGWHGWLGYADLLGRKNIKGYNAIATYQVSEAFNLQLNYLRFFRVDPSKPAYKTNTSGAWANNSDSSDIGSEIDLTVAYKVAKGPQFRLGVSKFFEGEYFTSQYDHGQVWFSYAEMEVRF